MYNNFPIEWDVENLEDITILVTDGSHFSPEHKEQGYPLATVANMRDEYVDLNSCYKISELDYNKLVKGNNKVEKMDVLFSKDGTVGRCLVFTQDDDLVVLSSIAIIRPNYSKLHSFYLKYALTSDSVLNRIMGSKTGTAIRRVILRDIRRIKIPVPPLVEQRGIVEVLGTVDECIRLTDAVIERAEELKRGLMQQLLTRGIGHTEYKMTSLGEIPRSWKINRLQDISIITGGSTPSTTNRDYWGGNIPFVTPSDITSLENENYILKTRRNITKKALISTSSSLLDPQTILLTSRATIGEAAINLIPVSTNQGFANIKPDSNVDVFWLFCYLRSKKREFERLASGSTFKEVSRKSVKRMKISLPPLNEQSRIAMIFLSMHEKIKSEYEKSRYLRLIKQGLMQQLLSGKLRVELKGDGLHRIRYGREANY